MDEIIEKNALMQERYLSGLYDGIEQGNTEKQKEIVIKMHQENIQIDLISKIVNLSIKEVNEIINQDK